MKLIFTLLLLFLSTSTKDVIIEVNDIDKDIVLVIKPDPLLYSVTYNECRGCAAEEIRIIIDCIRERVKHNYFPNTIDSVLIQPNQFASEPKDSFSLEFTNKIDSLWLLPKKYDYLYFRSKGYKHSSWMNKYCWRKVKIFNKQTKHEFGK